MCVIGGAMRIYICCDTMRSEPNVNLRRLWDSFTDREEMYDDNEAEGIALDTFQDGRTDNSNNNGIHYA